MSDQQIDNQIPDMYEVADEPQVSWELGLGCMALLLLGGAVAGLLVLLVVHLVRGLV